MRRNKRYKRSIPDLEKFREIANASILYPNLSPFVAASSRSLILPKSINPHAVGFLTLRISIYYVFAKRSSKILENSFLKNVGPTVWVNDNKIRKNTQKNILAILRYPSLDSSSECLNIEGAILTSEIREVDAWGQFTRGLIISRIDPEIIVVIVVDRCYQLKMVFITKCQ